MSSIRKIFSEIIPKIFTQTNSKEESDEVLKTTMMNIEMFEITADNIKDEKERKEIKQDATQTKQKLKNEYEQLAKRKSFAPIIFEIEKGDDKWQIELEEISKKRGSSAENLQQATPQATPQAIPQAIPQATPQAAPQATSSLSEVKNRSSSENLQQAAPKISKDKKDAINIKNPEWARLAESLFSKKDRDIEIDRRDFASDLMKLKNAELEAHDNYYSNFKDADKRMDSLRDYCGIKQSIRDILCKLLKENNYSLSMIRDEIGFLGGARQIVNSFHGELTAVLKLSDNLKEAIDIIQKGLNTYKGERDEKKQIQNKLGLLYEKAMVDSSASPGVVLKQHLTEFVSMLEAKKSEVHAEHTKGFKLFAKAGLRKSRLETELDKIIKELRETYQLSASEAKEVEKSKDISSGPRVKG
jgi:hypothetical protein